MKLVIEVGPQEPSNYPGVVEERFVATTVVTECQNCDIVGSYLAVVSGGLSFSPHSISKAVYCRIYGNVPQRPTYRGGNGSYPHPTPHGDVFDWFYPQIQNY